MSEKDSNIAVFPEKHTTEETRLTPQDIQGVLMDRSPIGVSFFDTQGKIIRANPALFELLNIGPRKAKTLGLEELIGPSADAVTEQLKAGVRDSYVIEAVTRGASIKNTVYSAQSESGEGVLVVQTEDMGDFARELRDKAHGIKNITAGGNLAVQLQEKSLNSAEELLENATKYTISLAECLLAIKNRELDQGLLPALVADHLGLIEEQIQKAWGKIGSSRNFSKTVLSSQQRTLEYIDQELRYPITPGSIKKEPLDMAGMVKDYFASQVKVFDDNDIGLNLFIEQGIPEIELDKGRVEEVLDNLTTNSLQAIFEKKKIQPGDLIQNPPHSLTVELREAGGFVGEEVMLAVSDTGVGIPFENLRKIFERKFTTKKGRLDAGEGIGMDIIKKIVESHGGRVQVFSRTAESSARSGSEFVNVPDAWTRVEIYFSK